MKDSSAAPVKTILTITIGFIAFYLVFKSPYFLYSALLIGAVSLLSELAAYYIHTAWMLLARLMSYIVPNIIMSGLFYVILTPIALLQRLLKKNRSAFLLNTSGSTFIVSNKYFNKESFEKPW